MLRYQIDGHVLTLIPTGAPTPEARKAAYDAIAADPKVPIGSLVLVDARRADTPVDFRDAEDRARLLVAGLGPKLGQAVAVVVPPRMSREAAHVQSMSGHLGVRVATFSDDTEARDWLEKFGG